MGLSLELSVLFYAACLIAFLAALFNRPIHKSAKSGWLSAGNSHVHVRKNVLWGLPLFLLLYGVGYFLHLEAVAGFPYFIGGLLGVWALSYFRNIPGLAGILLTLGGFILVQRHADPTMLPIPLLAAFFGLTIGQAFANMRWEEYSLPAILLLGHYWLLIAPPSPETMLHVYQAMLIIFLSVALLLRAVQSFSFIPEKPGLIRPVFVVLTSGLAAWLAIQTWLLNPALLSWVGLFAGGSLLSFLLTDSHAETDASSETEGVIRQNDSSVFTWLPGLIQLGLIGIAALVASRLFGTMGWLVLTTGLLTNRQISSAASVAALFFLGRILLQSFLYQHNANLTGINIAHPYASAALYIGFAAMLLIPSGLKALVTPAEKTSVSETSIPTSISFHPVGWSLLLLGSVSAGALANYFLHAEATGSLLVALSVAGLGVSLLKIYAHRQIAGYPLLLSLLITSGSLVGQELISLGNAAEKSEKLIVLTIAFLIFLIAFFLGQKGILWRKPIQIS